VCHSVKLWLLGLLALHAVLHCVAMANPREATIRGNVFRDNDYAFEIRAPDADWRFLDAEEVSAVLPDACMGLMNSKTGGVLIVIAEKLEGIALPDYTKIILSNLMAAGPAELLGRTELSIGEFPAERVHVSGVVDGIGVQYVIHITKRGDFFYQAFGWSAQSRFDANDESFDAISRSMAFLDPSLPPDRPALIATSDQEGFDWSVQGNRYENASYGIRVEIPAGWRFVVGPELADLNTSASVGVESGDPGLFVVYIVDPIGDVDVHQLREKLYENLRADFSARSFIETTPTIGESDALEVSFESDLGATVQQTIWTHWITNDQSYQAFAWWIGEPSQTASVRVRQSYEFLSSMSEEERLAVEQRIHGADSGNAVGPGFVYRDGLLQDFTHRYTYQAPMGMWKAATGEFARAEFEGSSFVLKQFATGTTMAFFPGRVESGDHAAYHELLVSDFAGEIPTQTITLPGRIERYVTKFDEDLENVDLTWVVTSFGHTDTRNVGLVIHGLKENLTDIDVRLPAIILGLDIPDQMPSETEQGEHYFLDRRLGYRVQTAEYGWKITTHELPDGMTSGSFVSLDQVGLGCMALAICREGIQRDDLVDALVAQLGLAGVDRSRLLEVDDTLGGIPARRIFLTGRQGIRQVGVLIWTAKRANTTYLFTVLSDTGFFGSTPETELVMYRDMFELVD